MEGCILIGDGLAISGSSPACLSTSHCQPALLSRRSGLGLGQPGSAAGRSGTIAADSTCSGEHKHHLANYEPIKPFGAPPAPPGPPARSPSVNPVATHPFLGAVTPTRMACSGWGRRGSDGVRKKTAFPRFPASQGPRLAPSHSNPRLRVHPYPRTTPHTHTPTEGSGNFWPVRIMMRALEASRAK